MSSLFDGNISYSLSEMKVYIELEEESKMIRLSIDEAKKVVRILRYCIEQMERVN